MSNFSFKKLGQRGATAIEYGLIAALVAVAGVTAFQGLGTKISGSYTNTAGKL